RRRHTRCYRDWSSDVCSSDLAKWLSAALLVCPLVARAQTTDSDYLRGSLSGRVLLEADNRAAEGVKVTLSLSSGPLVATVFTGEIGRATCREGVWSGVVGMSV